jgi:hypothetical protein
VKPIFHIYEERKTSKFQKLKKFVGQSFCQTRPLSTYEIWKLLVSLAKNNIANFNVLGLFMPKK